MRGGALAILGTDTGVGKTVVTAALALGLRRLGVGIAVMKPVASGGAMRGGVPVSGDMLWLRRVLGLSGPLEAMNPVCYLRPLAPWIAGRLERRRFDSGSVMRAFGALKRSNPGGMILVEGVGGVLVPLSGRETVASLCARMGLPALLVGRAGLGTINHTCLSVEALRARRVRVAGVVLNGAGGRDPSEPLNPRAIERLAGVRVLATLPRIARVSSGSGLERLSRMMPARVLRLLAAAAGARA